MWTVPGEPAVSARLGDVCRILSHVQVSLSHVWTGATEGLLCRPFQSGSRPESRQHYAQRARGMGSILLGESALLFFKCVNSLFIGIRMFSHHFFISSGIPSKQPYAASGTEAIPFSSFECLKNQRHPLLLFIPTDPGAHTCSPFLRAPPPQHSHTHSPLPLGLTCLLVLVLLKLSSGT